MADLGVLAKQILTATAIRLAYATTGRLATYADLGRLVGEQNLDRKTADRYAALFAAEHGLKYRLEYDDRPGSDARTYLGETSVLRGPSAAEAKRRVKSGFRMKALSLDDPAIRLHELGHVRDLGKRRWARAAANLAPHVANTAGAVVGQLGHPVLAGLVTALGSVPKLVQEWQASRYAKEFLERHVSKEEAERVSRLLNAAFRSYVYQTAAAGAAAATWQHLRPQLVERWSRA